MLKKMIASLGISTVLLLGSITLPARLFAANETVNVTTGWEVKKYTHADGRTFFARVPTCQPMAEQGCVSFMSVQRPLIVYGHAAGVSESETMANNALNNLAAYKADVIYLYAISKDNTRRWDAGSCCTKTPVDDVSYLVSSIQLVGNEHSVNSTKIGILGDSNGGMLAHKAACERPDIFRAGASFAGTYTGVCDKPKVKLAQWHGGSDNVVPVNGGTVVIDGRSITFPPASDIGTRMAKGSQYMLTVTPGLGHTADYWTYWGEIVWLSNKLGIK